MAEWEDVFSSSESASSAVEDVFGKAIGAAKEVFAGSGGGGSWSFDREQIDALITQWKTLLDDCQQDRTVIQYLDSTIPRPSPDQPSTDYAKQVLNGITALRESNLSMVSYIQDFIQKLEAARDGIQRTEDNNADPLQSAKAVFGQ